MENSKSVDQFKNDKYWETLWFLVVHEKLLVKQGSVVESYRKQKGERQGPYYNLRYRKEGKQCSFYLGKCPKLAELVRGLLSDIQQTYHTHVWHKKLYDAARKALGEAKKNLKQELAKHGIRMKGWETHGWRSVGTGIRGLEAGKPGKNPSPTTSHRPLTSNHQVVHQKSTSEDQFTTSKYSDTCQFLHQNRDLLAKQGSVAASRRETKTACYGPYYSIRYRETGKQCSFYLGKSPELAEEVTRLLADFQQPYFDHKSNQQLKKIFAKAMREEFHKPKE